MQNISAGICARIYYARLLAWPTKGRRVMTRDDLKLLCFILIALALWLIFLFGVNVAGG